MEILAKRRIRKRESIRGDIFMDERI